MSVRTGVLVNPVSRGGQTGRMLAELERLLQKHVGEYRLWITQRSGDGARLAVEAARAGVERLVIAGGDGTASEAISGLFEAGVRDVELGLLPLGSGRDFARGLGLGRDLEGAVARLATGRRRTVDVGRVVCRAPDGSTISRWFLNIASLGITGESMRWLEAQGQQGKRGRFSYLRSGIVGLAHYRRPDVTLRLDGRVVYQGGLMLAAVANGPFFGRGLHVAPQASISDGLLDVVVVGPLSLVASLWMFAKLPLGRHVRDRHVRMERGRVFQAESAARVWLEVDGEPIGTLPATIEVVPGAITLCGLPG